ncbi:Ocel1 [Phodopus roborovskii]|uniref:Ocel1 protein n=1 Tax=Phodopus roborovskii TaxID=109678 RepID=A0AAU9YZH4_PHORO|nr:Ocel1 [Phodopus roborovskii]
MQIHAGPAFRRGPPGSLDACRPRSRSLGHNTTCNSRPAAGGRQNVAAPRMPARECLQPHSTGPEPRTLVSCARGPQCQPRPRELCTRPRKIVFADELSPRTQVQAKKLPKALGFCPNPVPDYELKYPPVSSSRDRSRYAAVFQDQYGEFSELQRDVGATQAKLQQLEALLMSLPPPRSQVSADTSSVPRSLRLCFLSLSSLSTLLSPFPTLSFQKEAHMAARVWREFEKKRADPGFLEKQARCHYLKGKLKHLKAQIRKFDDQGDSHSEDSVYF